MSTAVPAELAADPSPIDDSVNIQELAAELTTSRRLLRFATAGSVDDGKSTLVGRLLHDSKSVLSDTLDAVERTSQARGLDTPDLSLLVDGLRAEREQGITIDVAYRFFATDRRKYIVADTPGHEQYTRNMVTGASTADLAVILIDARKGVLTQTRRHSYLVNLIGIRRIDRRRGRDPDRRAQGRAHADAPPQLPGKPDRHPQGGAGHQQDGPRRLLAEGVREDQR